MAEATKQALGPAPMLIPIYCTAKIPPGLIDTLITRTYMHAPPKLYLVDDARRATDAFDTCTYAKPPTAPFTSPFLNHTLPQLKEHFLSLPDNRRFFSSYTFIVLDERSIREETCLIVSTIPEYESDEDLSTARADFYVAVEVLIPAEMRSHRLNEGIKATWREDDGQVLFTKERMAEIMGEDYKFKDTSPRIGIDGQVKEWPARFEDLWV